MKKSQVEVKCQHCQKVCIFEKKIVKQKESKGYNHTCSLECRYALRGLKPSREVSCFHCKKVVKKREVDFEKSKSGLNFCSRSCAATVNNKNPNRRPNSLKIGSYRKIVTISKCNRCTWNEHPEILQVHHIDRNVRNNKIENLEVLCPTCHTWEHFLAKDGIYHCRL